MNLDASLINDMILLTPITLIILVSIYLTIISRGIQFRIFSVIWQALNKPQHEHTATSSTLSSLAALTFAMSTTIGIGNIVGPIVALGCGGPGTLLGFVVGTLLGNATTFTEVALAIKYKISYPGIDTAGPMPYIKAALGGSWELVYAFCCAFMLIGWSAGQSNALAGALAQHGLPALVSGIIISVSILALVTSGSQVIGRLSTILVPVMFFGCSGMLTIIIFKYAHNLPDVMRLIVSHAWSPATACGVFGGFGYTHLARWGFTRIIQINEIGVGTVAFPHTLANTPAHQQASLATLTGYTNGILCILTGLAILVSGVYLQPNIRFDISLIIQLMSQQYGWYGPYLLSFCAFLFAYGTILGNWYNGLQCFAYVTKHRWVWVYNALTTLLIGSSALFATDVVWGAVDYLIIPALLPHLAALVMLARVDTTVFELPKPQNNLA